MVTKDHDGNAIKTRVEPIPGHSIVTPTQHNWLQNDNQVYFLISLAMVGTLSSASSKDSSTSEEYHRVIADLVYQIRTTVANLRFQTQWA